MVRITHEAKLRIVQLLYAGEKSSVIRAILKLERFDLTRGQLSYFVKQHVNGYFDRGKPAQTKRVKAFMSVCDIEIVKTALNENPNQSSRDIHKLLKSDGANVSLRTTKRIIEEAGFTNDRPRYANMVKNQNKTPQIDFCRTLIESNDTLDDIIFTDESSVQLHNNKTTAYHPRGTKNSIIPKPKHPLKIHVWAGISRRGPTPILLFDGILESTFFTEQILGNTLLTFIQRTYSDGHRFQQDNDLKHRSKIAREFMTANGINWWNVWPSESLDLNPIKMVWNQMKRFVAKAEPKTKEELCECIQEFWTTTMTVELCNKYINHVFKVPPVCVFMSGNATGDILNKVFPERSRNKSFAYFQAKLETRNTGQIKNPRVCALITS